MPDGRKEFIAVDAEAGERREAFDHQRLANGLGKVNNSKYDPQRLPFDQIAFSDDQHVAQFVVDEKTFECHLDFYKCLPVEKTETQKPDDRAADDDRNRRGGRWRRLDRQPTSPDGQWRARIRNHNILLEKIVADQVAEVEAPESIKLTLDGTDRNRYDLLQWSPDSKTLVAFQVAAGDEKQVHLLESSPADGGRARLHSRNYSLPGDKLPEYSLKLYRVDEGKFIDTQAESVEREWGRPRVRWLDGGERLAYEKIDRGHQRFRLIEVTTATGETRN